MQRGFRPSRSIRRLTSLSRKGHCDHHLGSAWRKRYHHGRSARTGVGVSDFVTVRDSGTEELAYVLANSIRQRFGKSPYVVVCKADRLYVDINRSSANAYEHPDAGLVYNYYHQMMKAYTRAVANQFHCGLVLDIHGQGTASSTVFRGTRDGATCRFLRTRHGEPAHHGPNSMFGLLSSAGWTINPNPSTGAEHSSFNGGFIVGTYGSQTSGAVDAIQFEFGSNYRATASNRSQTSATLTNALATYAKLYLRVRVPN